jgi:hypothetical protein
MAPLLPEALGTEEAAVLLLKVKSISPVAQKFSSS